MDESTKKIAESFQCKYTLFEKGTDPELRTGKLWIRGKQAAFGRR